MCEVTNAHLFDLFRSRARSLLRYRRGGRIRQHPTDYDNKISEGDTLVAHHRGGDGFYRVDKVEVFAAADAANHRAEKYLAELNAQRVGELVRPGELHQGVRSGDYGERTTPGRQRDDGGSLDRREERATAKAR